MELRGHRRANKPQSGLFSRHYFNGRVGSEERFSYSFLIKIFDFYQEGAAVSVALLRQSAAKAVS